MCEKTVKKNPSMLKYVPDYLKTEKMCERAVEEDSWSLANVPDHFKRKDMCKGVHLHTWLIGHFPDHFKRQDMCNEAVELDPFFLRFVPDWFVSQEQLKLWHDGDDWLIRWWYNNRLIKWYDRYEKRKAQKAKIKEELMRVAKHLSRWWDWCMSEDEKQETEKLWE